MKENINRERNFYVDALRGIAMLMVVLGHTMTGSSEGSQQSFLFQIVWSLQMPLFILISGYVTRYSSEIKTIENLTKYVKKRTIAYLFPWIVWTILIRGILFENKSFLNPSYIFWHMDSGYWFLFTLWTICIVFGIGQFLSNKIASQQSAIKKLMIFAIVYVVGMIFLLVIGLIFGMTFLGAKLTLYYMPFYFAGFLYGQIEDELHKRKWGNTICEVCVAISFAIWLVIISKINLYEMADSGIGIIVRAIASLTGCIAVSGLLKNILSPASGSKTLAGGAMLIGKHSLEIYVTHYLLLNLVKLQETPCVTTVTGIGIIVINYLLTVLLTIIVVIVIRQNRWLNMVVYGKRR